MSIDREIEIRSGLVCEICTSTDNLTVYTVDSKKNMGNDGKFLACSTCTEQIDNPDKVDVNHWRCLNDSMWSEVPAVQVIAWRMLNRLRAEGWPADLLDMMYLDEETLKWAKATGEGAVDDDAPKHLDSNGVALASGDTVLLIKNLEVKGSNQIGKQGTPVRNIKLIADNPEQIEGRVNDQQIIILTKFVKKSS